MNSTTPFFGRQDELGALRRALDDPCGKAVLVIGPQGMGKSSLIERFLADAEADPNRPCVTMSFQVTKDDEARFLLGLMLGDIEAAIQDNASFMSVTPRGRTQWRAVMSVLPKGEEIINLLQTLRGRKERHPRDDFIEYLAALSRVLEPEDGRAIVAIDANRQLHAHSDDTWRVITERLPPRIMLIFGQRPEDVLAASREFRALPNVQRIPESDLHALSDRAVEELVGWGSKETGIDGRTLAGALERYDGHPYALTAAVGLLRDGVPLDRLPPDPTPERIAEAQWERVKDRHGPEAMRLLKAHAVLEVPASVALAREVSGLDVDRHESLLTNPFLASLLQSVGDGRKVYHAILRDHVIAPMDEDSARAYHERAAGAYRAMLSRAREEGAAPDPTACSRAFLHARWAEGMSESVRVFVEECTMPLIRLGLFETVREATTRFLAEVPEVSVARAALMGNLGMIAKMQGKLEEAERCHREALMINETVNRPYGQAQQLGNLALIARLRRRFEEAEDLLWQAYEIHVSLEDPIGMASDLGNLGQVARDRGDLKKAKFYYERSLALVVECGDLEGQAIELGNLAVIALLCDNVAEAESRGRDALSRAKQLGYVQVQADQMSLLAQIAKQRGDTAEARRLWTEARDLYDYVGTPHRVAQLQVWIDDLAG